LADVGSEKEYPMVSEWPMSDVILADMKLNRAAVFHERLERNEMRGLDVMDLRSCDLEMESKEAGCLTRDAAALISKIASADKPNPQAGEPAMYSVPLPGVVYLEMI
jgi:hypothetical protein